MSNYNNEQFVNKPEKSPVVNNFRNPCKCTEERVISTISAAYELDAKWFCTNCGGYTEKKGVPIYSRYGQQRKIYF